MNIPTQYLDRNVSGILAGILHDRAYDRTAILLDALEEAEADEATMRDALMWWVLAEPGRDEPRLRWAEAVGGDRGEFARVQCAIARLGSCTDAGCLRQIGRYDPECKAHGLKKREGALWDSRSGSGPDAKYLLFPNTNGVGTTISPGLLLPSPFMIIRRGFADEFVGSRADWLRLHAAIYYHPNQRVACPCEECYSHIRHPNVPQCKNKGTVPRPFTREVACHHCDGAGLHRTEAWSWSCPQCSGSGRITQSLAATAQPITKVRLTEPPPLWTQAISGEVNSFALPGLRFARMKCGTCDGSGRLVELIHGRTSFSTCPVCKGEPLNEWKCETWPTITFAMPA